MNIKQEINHYLNSDGKLITWPSKSNAKILTLYYLSNHFEWSKFYSEKEVNEILNKIHTFNDPALLRRELYENKFLDREADVSKYWKTGNQISRNWDTEHVTIKNVEENEIEKLEEIYKNLDYIGKWTGLESKEEHPMRLEFEHKNLPSNGQKELHRLQSIKLKDSNKIMGYFVFYHGFPDERTFWIAVLAIHTDYQGKKFGQEVVAGLIKEVKHLQIYNRIGGSVGIKNWPAIRFWINAGLNTIINFKGDNIYNERSFADLWLVKNL